ncbi:MAG: hypothetical protein R2769_03105 [Saprospiraceae bacterium]
MLGKQDMHIQLDETAKNYLADLGYDPQFGARPLKRVIQKELVNKLSKEILSANVGPGDTISVSTNPLGLVFEKSESVRIPDNGLEEVPASENGAPEKPEKDEK